MLHTWNGAFTTNVWIETAAGAQIRIVIPATKPSGRFQIYNITRASMTGYGGGATSTTLDTDLITKIKIVVLTGSATATDYPFWVGPVKQDTRGEKAKICLCFDKVSSNQYTYLRPLLESYGFKASLAVITQPNDANAMTIAQKDKMYSLGHEIIHHTGNDIAVPGAGWDNTTKYPTGGTAASLIAEDIKITQDDLIAHGWTRGLGHCVMGFSSSFSSSVPMIRQQEIITALKANNMLSVRSTIDAVALARPLNLGIFDGYGMGGGLFVTSAVSGATVNAAIDEIIAENGYGFISGHDFAISGGTGNTQNIADVETWMAYLKTKVDAGLVDVVTQSELYDELSSYNQLAI